MSQISISTRYRYGIDHISQYRLATILYTTLICHPRACLLWT